MIIILVHYMNNKQSINIFTVGGYDGLKHLPKLQNLFLQSSFIN